MQSFIYLFLLIAAGVASLCEDDVYRSWTAIEALDANNSSLVVLVTVYMELYSSLIGSVDGTTKSIELPIQLDGTMYSVEIALEGNHSQMVEDFCSRHSLIDIYCEQLQQYVQVYVGKTLGSKECATLQCCLSLNNAETVCTELLPSVRSSWSSAFESRVVQHEFVLNQIRSGRHKLQAWLGTSNGSYVSGITPYQFHIKDSIDPCVEILYPRKGNLLNSRGSFQLKIHNSAKNSSWICVQLNEEAELTRCELETQLKKQTDHFSYELQAGRHRLAAWRTNDNTGTPSRPDVCTSVEFKVTERESKTVIVTAASRKYFIERRLQNLIGSIHYWEPDRLIHVVSLDLDPFSIQEISRWKNVVVTSFNFTAYPSHVENFRTTYAFKPLVIAEALNIYDEILWLDANMEIRRPLDDFEDIFIRKGYFFTIQEAGFPIEYNNDAQTLAILGCTASWYARTTCASGIQAYKANSWAHYNILNPMVECAKREECFSPPDSRYPDQTVLNAVLCAQSLDICDKDQKWWMSTSLNDQQPGKLQPTQDETEFNHMIIYTRREVPAKPYVKHLNYK